VATIKQNRLLSVAAQISKRSPLREWELATGQEHLVGDLVVAFAYSPDGKRVLFVTTGGTLSERELATGQQFRHYGDSANACAYSPDGKRVLSASSDGTLREWEVATGQELRCFEGHTGCLTACAYSPDGECAVSASDDATVKTWCRSTGRCIGTVCGIGAFKCIAIAPHRIVAGDVAGNLWFLECDWF
jgi:WD40 repeat protein